MLSFKTFLDPFSDLVLTEEAAFNDSHFKKTYEDEDNTERVHTAKIGKHKVGIVFNSGPMMKHTMVDFHVNGASDKGFMDKELKPHEGRAILHHVAKVVHGYKATYEPKGFAFAANSGQKSGVYRHFAHHLAKHYGGEAHTSPHSSQLHFVKFRD